MSAGKYTELLQRDYEQELEQACVAPDSKIEYLGNRIFDFTTYDSELDVYFAEKMIEVLQCLIDRKTFQYIESSRENYINYITMCNTPFLENKLEWGTSIRGAWIDEYRSDCEIQCTDINIPKGEMEQFFRELIEWSKSGSAKV
jgi:hypothetical protein